MCERVFGTPYTHPESGAPILITQGLGASGPWWACCVTTRGAIRRIRTPALPDRETAGEVLLDLQAWCRRRAATK